MALRRLVLAALLAAASLAIVEAAVSREIIGIRRDPPEPIDAATVELLEFWEEGEDAVGDLQRRSTGGSCAGCHARSFLPLTPVRR